MFHSFLHSLARSKYLSLFSLSLIFTLWSTGTAKSTIREVLFFCLLLLGLVIIIIIIIIISLYASLSHLFQLIVFHSSLSDSKSLLVFRILLNILADLKSACMVSVLTHFEFLQYLFSVSPVPFYSFSSFFYSFSRLFYSFFIFT